MTDSDDRIERELRQQFRALQTPPADPAARRQAIAQAVAAFEGLHASSQTDTPVTRQGIAGHLRLIVSTIAEQWRSIMQYRQKTLVAGIASAFAGVVAVGIGLQYLPLQQVNTEPHGVADPVSLAAEPRDGMNVPAPAAAYQEPKKVGEPQASSRDQDGTAAQLHSVGKTAGDTAVTTGTTTARSEHAGRQAAARDSLADVGTITALEALPYAEQSVPGVAAPGVSSARPADGDVVAVPPYYQDTGRDRFEPFEQSSVKLVSEEPVSTFSVDVDTASYSFVRRQLRSGVLPQDDAVRVEEMINYFDYDYPLPEDKAQPFAPSVAVSAAPWATGRELIHIGIKGYELAAAAKPHSNLVFLLDVSGSMNSPDKLPLVKQSMELLLSTLDPDDTVAIAVYAGAAGTVLDPTPVRDKQKIVNALRQLNAGGSTAGAQGIRLAYELAETGFVAGAVNRVVLATDGDFNVGIRDQRELQSFIERKRDTGIFLSVLGFGQGNYQDSLMQTLAQNGNGVAAYIDSLSEAQKVLVDEATSTLFPIAKDVKVQVEFNPAVVAEYRLIGYETRHLNREDFNNDAVDAGDIGAGHTVTAIYEITPVESSTRQIDDSRYAPRNRAAPAAETSEYAFLKLRYKLPDGDESRLLTRPITAADAIDLGAETTLSRESGFATAVAGFAQLLKGGRYTGDYDYDDVISLAQRCKGADPFGYRAEFIQLVRQARSASAMLPP